MTTKTGVERHLMAMTLLWFVTLAIGIRYTFESTGIPRLAGLALIVGSLATLCGYLLAFLRGR